MNAVHYGFTATALRDGKVLVVGALHAGPAEVYDPQQNRWNPAGTPTTPRFGHAATLLADGRVLITGGCGANDPQDSNQACSKPLATAEIYDPATGEWRATGSMSTTRTNHTATLLPDGRVLVAGGCSNQGCPDILPTAELYNPVTGAWSPTGTMSVARVLHTATLLPNGLVLVVGGDLAARQALPSTAELFDPASGRWRATADAAATHLEHTATLLPNGPVLIAGGCTDVSSNCRSAIETELYDSAHQTWLPAGSIASTFLACSAALLPDGQVLLVGMTPYQSNLEAVRYDPTTNTWGSDMKTALEPQGWFTSTLLRTGAVLVIAGNSDTPPTAEIYQASTGP